MAFNHSPKIVTDGLILYLDAGSPKSYTSGSSIWKDLSGNKNDFTLNGSLTHSYKFGFSGFTFPNRWYRNNFPTNLKTAQGGNGLTTIVWTRNNGATNGYQKLIGNGDEQNYIDLYANTTDGTYHQEDGSSLFINAGISVSQNTFPMGDSVWRMYISTNLNNGTVTNPTDAFGIGGEGDGAYGYSYNGNIMSVMIYNKILSIKEMTQNYNATKARFNLT